MQLLTLINKLDWLAKVGIDVYSTAMMRHYFPEDSPLTLKKSLERAINKGVLVRPCRGVYLSPNNTHNNPYLLEAIAKVLRSGHYSYVSLETALSEFSIISQMTINYLTLMTTGRSQTYTTPFGTIEFTHTARDEIDILNNTTKQQGRPLRIAQPQLALADLKRVNRNLELVNMTTYAEVLHDITH